MNHLLLPAFGSEVLQMDVPRVVGFARPDHERLPADGQLAALHLAKNHIIGQALVSLPENIGVIHGARLPIQEPVEIISGDATSGGDDLATVEAVTWVFKAGIELTEFIQRKKLDFDGGGV